MKYAWKIESIKALNGLITQAKYHVRAENGELWVATEGTWFFKDLTLNVPFADVTEDMIVSWVKAEAGSLIETRLAEQLAAIESDVDVPLPWLPQTFTPKI